MITVLLVLYHGTNAQYICTAAFIAHNMCRYYSIHTYIMHIHVQHVCMYLLNCT